MYFLQIRHWAHFRSLLSWSRFTILKLYWYSSKLNVTLLAFAFFGVIVTIVAALTTGAVMTTLCTWVTTGVTTVPVRAVVPTFWLRVLSMNRLALVLHDGIDVFPPFAIVPVAMIFGWIRGRTLANVCNFLHLSWCICKAFATVVL